MRNKYKQEKQQMMQPTETQKRLSQVDDVVELMEKGEGVMNDGAATTSMRRLTPQNANYNRNEMILLAGTKSGSNLREEMDQIYTTS